MLDLRNIFCILRRMRWRQTPCNAQQKLSRHKIFADHIHFAFIYCTATKTATTNTCARVAILTLCLGLACMPGCAGGGKKKSPNLSDRAGMVTGGSSGLKDETITLQQLDAISNAFADRYYTLMLAASERVMYNLLGVSSMYDIASSPDVFTQLIDQLVVVTLQNYYWVDSGRSQKIFGDRAQPLVENLRRAREDVWSSAARVFTKTQLERLDLIIANWWRSRGGTEFVAYVRFADIATSKGVALVEEVKDGGGLLEPVDRAVERAAEAQQAFERALFYSKRLPLFINWQVEALIYDVLIMPETQQVLGDVNRINAVVADAPNLLQKNTAVASQLLTQYQDSINATSLLLEKIAPLANTAERITKEAGTSVAQVNTTLNTIKQMQPPPDKNAPVSKPVEIADYIKLLNEMQQNLEETSKILSTTDSLLGSSEMAERLKPIESLMRARVDEVHKAADQVVNDIFIRVIAVVLGIFALITLLLWWRGKGVKS
jgi:hypothetical protein